MDKLEAIKELLEADGRYLAPRVGSYYVDPERDPIEGKDPIFGAWLVGRHSYDGKRPVVVVPMAEDLVESEDPEVVASMILEHADFWVEDSLEGL